MLVVLFFSMNFWPTVCALSQKASKCPAPCALFSSVSVKLDSSNQLQFTKFYQEAQPEANAIRKT